MLELAQQRARERRVAIETLLCPAEQLALPDQSVDLLISKHFLRFARDLDAVLLDWRRVLKPGGRLYAVDFNAEGPWFGKRLLHFWIQVTGPGFLRQHFWSSMQRGLPASSLSARLTAAGLREPRLLRSSVSYLVRADRPET
jgi:ubiquinone/menaquinone biosynthesis C-methylase UbiE